MKMKYIFWCLFIVSLSIVGCVTKKVVTDYAPKSNTVKPNEVEFAAQETWLLGYFDLYRLKQKPYSDWYFNGFDKYQPDNEVMGKLKVLDINNLSIKIVMGTWCPDSRREIPRFMKIMDMWQFPLSKITFIGVDDLKFAPVGEYGSLRIERVPTFIVLKNNIECGRIIENPVTSLEQDLVNIISGK
jgi:thiol-disulfide isomerase/thioredoxin